MKLYLVRLTSERRIPQFAIIKELKQISADHQGVQVVKLGPGVFKVWVPRFTVAGSNRGQKIYVGKTERPKTTVQGVVPGYLIFRENHINIAAPLSLNHECGWGDKGFSLNRETSYMSLYGPLKDRLDWRYPHCLSFGKLPGEIRLLELKAMYRREMNSGLRDDYKLHTILQQSNAMSDSRYPTLAALKALLPDGMVPSEITIKTDCQEADSRKCHFRLNDLTLNSRYASCDLDWWNSAEPKAALSAKSELHFALFVESIFEAVYARTPTRIKKMVVFASS
jgi:hypothetical protein